MARSRNIKPGFFKNEDLAECSAWARLCFAGLWTLADREGRLEDRPKRIKGDLFAFDTIEVEPLLVELAQYRFILRYAIASQRFIQILKFHKHQNPHHKEPPSVIPSPESLGLLPHAMNAEPGALPPCDGDLLTPKPQASPGLLGDECSKHGGKTVLIPDSGFLIPSTLIPDSLLLQPAVVAPKQGRSKKQSPLPLPENFEPNETGKALAAKNGLDLDSELDAFKNWHESKGSMFVSWQAAFRTWLNKAPGFKANSTKRASSGRHTGFDQPGYYGGLENGIPE